jgi:hypothetical protein
MIDLPKIDLRGKNMYPIKSLLIRPFLLESKGLSVSMLGKIAAQNLITFNRILSCWKAFSALF